MKKDTWFARHATDLAFIFGIALIIGAALLYAFPPQDKTGSAASGSGFVLPFVIVLATIGLVLVLLAFGLKDVVVAYFRSKQPKVTEKSEEPPAGGA